MNFAIGNFCGLRFSDDMPQTVEVFDGENCISLPLGLVFAFVQTHNQLAGKSETESPFRKTQEQYPNLTATAVRLMTENGILDARNAQ